jgi:hypothetical protein
LVIKPGYRFGEIFRHWLPDNKKLLAGYVFFHEHAGPFQRQPDISINRRIQNNPGDTKAKTARERKKKMGG